MDGRESAVKIYTVACICAVTTGFSFMAAKTSLIYATALEALFSRFFLAVVFAGLLGAAGAVRFQYRGKPIKLLFWPAVLYSVGFFGFQFVGLIYATSVEAGILYAVMPAFTMIIADLFLKERSNWIQRACMIMSLVSVVTLFFYCNGSLGQMDPLGFFLLLISSLSMAANNVLLRWIRGIFSPAEVSLASCTMGLIVYSVMLLVSGAINGTLQRTAALFTNVSFLTAAVYLGIGCTMLTTLMNAYLMTHLEAIKTSAFSNLGTLITICAGSLLLQEPLTWVHIVCSAVIIAGVLGTNFFMTPKHPEHLSQTGAEQTVRTYIKEEES